MNLSNNLERSASLFPDRPAIIEGDREYTFLEFDQESNRFAIGLSRLGIKPGEHVAIYAPSSFQWLACYFGILKIGAVAVTLPSSLTASELHQLLDDSRPKILFTVDEKLNDLGDRKKRLYLEKVISPGGDLSYKKLIEMGSASFKALDLDRKCTAVILYTGGTTGVPKGVMLSHENIKSSAHNVSHFERSTYEDRALCFLPLNHIFAQIHIMNSMVYTGASLVLQPSFDLDRVLDTVKRRHITKFYGVPTIYYRFLQLDGLKEKLGPVNYCFSAAASLPGEIVREWKSRTSLNIHESFGMTETASMVTYNHYTRHTVGSIGTPVNIVEAQIRDPEGTALGPNEEGEICICGPNVMKGYLNKPEETKATFWGNWLRSGDIGLYDEKGYFYIIDRIKDMIISGGENVYPREIEEILYKIPEVGECSVIGVPDKEYGEKVMACIVSKKKGWQPDPAELKTFLKTHLTPFKVPKEFILLEELPKGSTGKILKRELRKKITDLKK